MPTASQALEAFAAKCGPKVDLFRDDRFSIGLQKATALSRVVVWSALKEKFDLLVSVTPGQVATIVDAAPIIVGKTQRAQLASVLSLEQLDEFIRINASKWAPAIVAFSQFWSLHRLAHDKPPANWLANSTFTIHDVAAATIGCAIVAEGLHERLAPEAILECIDAGSELTQTLVKMASQADPCPDPKTHQERAATFLSLGIEGRWTEVVHGRLSEPYLAAAEKADFEYRGISREPVPGAFLGPKNLPELRQLTNPAGCRREDSVAFFRRMPFFNYIYQTVCRLTAVIDEDVVMSAVSGCHRAWETYSPIVIPGLSVTEVKKRSRGTKENIPLAANDLFREDNALPQGVVSKDHAQQTYAASRLPVHLQNWVKKFVWEQMAKESGIHVPRAIREIMSQAYPLIEEMMTTGRYSGADAIELALVRVKARLENRGISSETSQIDIDAARHLLNAGSLTVSMDRTPCSSGSGDLKESSLHDKIANTRMVEAPGRAAFLDLDSQSVCLGDFSATESYIDRFDMMYNFACTKAPEIGESLAQIALGTRIPDRHLIARIDKLFERTLNDPALSQRYMSLLENARTLFEAAQENGRTQHGLFLPGLDVDAESVGAVKARDRVERSVKSAGELFVAALSRAALGMRKTELARERVK